MNFDSVRKIVGVILLVSLIGIGFYKPIQEYVSIPSNITLFQGQEAIVAHTLPVEGSNSREAIYSVKNHSETESLSIKGNESGEEKMLLQLGNLPVKEVNVKILPDFKVVPGGQSIGVKLNTVGVLVVGHHLIETESGKKSPGEIAGIEIGDMITQINGQSVEKMSEVKPFVEEAGKNNESLKLEVKREDTTFSTELTPLKAVNEQNYRLGLYIRDSAAGIGTMSFYHPESKKYGALGHVISDMDTKKPIVVNDGKVLRSEVTSIQKGSNGSPGEKRAIMPKDSEVIGNITRNSPFGIFGELSKGIKNGIMDEPMPIALSNQVEEGPAKMLTVVNNDKVEAFDIEIVSSIEQKFPATKGMVIKVTDPKLLNATGGIVQGMSGSPIIQNGKVIGAVTHVFVNDPTSGYGVHIEWMLNEAGINIYEKQERKAS